MAGYAVVIGGNVEEIHYVLPKNWKNVSNFDALQGDRDALINLGWYPLHDNIPSYNPETQILTTHYVVHPYHVERTGTVTSK